MVYLSIENIKQARIYDSKITRYFRIDPKTGDYLNRNIWYRRKLLVIGQKEADSPKELKKLSPSSQGGAYLAGASALIPVIIAPDIVTGDDNDLPQEGEIY